MRAAIEPEIAEKLLHLLAAKLVADLRGDDVRTVDQRLGNIEPAVHHVRIADVEAGDGERLGRVIAFGHAGDDAIGDRSADRQRLEGRTERSEEHTSDLQSLMRNSYAVFR